MPRKCCVPRCSSNYDGGGDYVTVFRFPKDEVRRQEWLRRIHREDFNPSSESVVCIKHFDRQFVLWDDCVTKDDGTELHVKRTKPKLSNDAFPSFFNGQPSYLTAHVPPKRTSPTKRKKLQEQREQNEQKRRKQEETLFTLEKLWTIVKRNTADIQYPWTVTGKSQQIIFIKLSVGPNSCPEVLYYLVIDPSLKVTFYIRNREATRTEAGNVGLQHPYLQTWQQLKNVMQALDGLDTDNEDSLKVNNIVIATELLQEELRSSEDGNEFIQFIVEQLKLSQIPVNLRSYSSDVMLLSYTVMLHSRRAYEIMRNSSILYLPHERTLRRLGSTISSVPDMNSDQFKYLKNQAAVVTSQERLVNLQIDEIHVDPKMVFKGNNISGFAAFRHS